MPFPRLQRANAKWVLPLGLTLTGLIAAGLIWAWCYPDLRASRSREAEARAAIKLGEDYLKAGQPDRALDAVANVPEQGPWQAGVLSVKGLALAALDQPEKAQAVLERSLELDPAQPMATKVLAAVYFNARETDRGFQMLDRAARLDPQDFRPWFATGEMILRFRNRPADAAQAYKEALKRRPDHEESRVGLIDALLAGGEITEATPLLQDALRDHPDDPRVQRLAARLARLQDKPEVMERFATRSLASEPDNLEALLLKAQALQQLGRLQDALPVAERAVAVEPNDLTALNLLAMIESSLGLKDRSAATAARHRKAGQRMREIEQLTEQINQRPNDPEPHWRLGQIAADSGMSQLARNSFRAALALDPNCQPARQGLLALESPRAGSASTTPMR